jgi:hypothetical protein
MMSAVSFSFARLGDWPQPLIDLLERQRSLVDQLAGLAQSQAALIAERRTERLLELLEQRQSIIDDFTAAQGEMSAMTEHLDERIAGLGTPQRDRIRTLINAIGERLGEVMQRDQEDQAHLRSERDQVHGELQGVGTARAARNAYGPAATPSINRFADRRG